MEKGAKIYIAGHKGLVGSAILRGLLKDGFNNLVFKTSTELDLRKQSDVENFFKTERPEYVFLAAAKVGGILANNNYPAEFIYDNLLIESNIIGMSNKYDVKKLMFLGSSCIYPKYALQPMAENSLLTGELEPTNEAYAIAKIAGIKLCSSFNRQYGTNYLSVMPTNLYGPNDNFDLESSHVLPALLRKFHEAKVSNAEEVVIWGTGKPRREFLHVDDLADAVIFLMKNYDVQDIGEFVNVGTGEDISIIELANMIKEITEFVGEITFDTTKPDGTPRKLLNVTKLNELGWKDKICLEEGITQTYKWALENIF